MSPWALQHQELSLLSGSTTSLKSCLPAKLLLPGHQAALQLAESVLTLRRTL